MPLTKEDLSIVARELGKLALPAGFQGDRLDAFRLGAEKAADALIGLVSLDKPKPEAPPKP